MRSAGMNYVNQGLPINQMFDNSDSPVIQIRVVGDDRIGNWSQFIPGLSNTSESIESIESPIISDVIAEFEYDVYTECRKRYRTERYRTECRKRYRTKRYRTEQR